MRFSKYIKPTITTIILAVVMSLQAQESRTLTFDNYLKSVRDSNINYLVEKLNIDIAEANLSAAKVFPNPQLSLGYTNNQNRVMQMGYEYEGEISYTIELGGKRGARIGLAKSEKELEIAMLEDYFRNLRADATLAYLSAIKHRDLYNIQRLSYLQMREIAQADSIRYSLGYITQVDAKQTRLEASAIQADLLESEGDYFDALEELKLYQGSSMSESIDSLRGELFYTKVNFVLSDLMAMAVNNRADMLAALKHRDVSQSALRLAKANRAIDIELSLGGAYVGEAINELAPSPHFKAISAGIAIPLNFSAFNRGEVKAAQFGALQSERQIKAIEQQIGLEVRQAYNRYLIASKQVALYENDMIQEAELILHKKIYSYERGETQILDLLDAQRTYNDIRINYYESLFNFAASLVELERVCGITDINYKI